MERDGGERGGSWESLWAEDEGEGMVAEDDGKRGRAEPAGGGMQQGMQRPCSKGCRDAGMQQGMQRPCRPR